MPNLNVIVSANITVQDIAGSTTPVNRNLGNPTLGATANYFDAYFQAASTGTAVPLPGRSYFIYVQNLSPSANLTVEWTPFGSASSSIILGPGGFITFMDPSETVATNGGIAAMTLTGAGGTVPAYVQAAF